MGKKTIGMALLNAIETNDHPKVHEILAVQIHSKAKVQEICVADIKRPPSEFTDCPLIMAAKLDDGELLKYLVTKHGVSINFVHKDRTSRKGKLTTCLMMAVRYGLYDTVETILSLSADSNVQDHNGRTALHHAVRKANFKLAKMLLGRGANANMHDNNGNSPLLIATKLGHVELVKLLLQNNADVYKKGPYGAIPIHVAAREGHIALLRVFVFHDVNVNIKVPCYGGMREKTPLHVASEQGHVETVLALLEQFGADVNVRDSEGETPLTCTVLHEYDQYGMKSKEDYTETAKVLLKFGANANMINGRGETAMHLAARNEFQRIVELLIQAGADPSIRDNNGDRPIDLVSDSDAVTKNYLKRAAVDREKLVNELLETRARGFSTSSHMHSQSSLNSSFMSRTSSTPGIYMPGSMQSGIAPIYEDGYLAPRDSRFGSDSARSSQITNGSTFEYANQTPYRPPSHGSLSSGLNGPTYASIDEGTMLRDVNKDPSRLRKEKKNELRRSREFQLAQEIMSDSSQYEDLPEKGKPPMMMKKSMSIDALLRKHGANPEANGDRNSAARNSITSHQSSATNASTVESSNFWKVTPKSSVSTIKDIKCSESSGSKRSSIESVTSTPHKSESQQHADKNSPQAKRNILRNVNADNQSTVTESTVNNDQEVTIHINTPKAKRSTPEDKKQVLSTFSLTTKDAPHKFEAKPKGGMSDSDDTFFDDESFDSVSETDTTTPINQADTFGKGDRQTVLIEANTLGQRNSPKTVEVEDPKMKSWLVEQAKLAQGRKGGNTENPQTSPHVDRRPKLTNASDSDDGSVKKFKPPVLGPKPSSKPTTPQKPKAEPPGIVTPSKDKIATPQAPQPKQSPKLPPKPIQTQQQKPVLPPRTKQGGSGESSIKKAPVPLPPEKTEQKNKELFKRPPPPPPKDSGADVEVAAISSKAKIPLPKTEDAPPQKKPVPVPDLDKPIPGMKPVLRPKSKDPNEPSPHGLHWERVDETVGDSLYWEHTGTEEIYKAIKDRSFENKDQEPTEMEEDHYLPMAVAAPKAEMEDLTDYSGRSKSPSNASASEDEDDTEVPNSCHLVAKYYAPKYNRNANTKNLVMANKPPLHAGIENQRHSSTSSKLVPVPGAAELARNKAIADEYKFHRQMGDLSAASSTTIKDSVDRKMSDSESPGPKQNKQFQYGTPQKQSQSPPQLPSQPPPDTAPPPFITRKEPIKPPCDEPKSSPPKEPPPTPKEPVPKPAPAPIAHTTTNGDHKPPVEYAVPNKSGAKKPPTAEATHEELARGRASLSRITKNIPPPAVPDKHPEIMFADDDNDSNGTFDTFDSFDSTDSKDEKQNGEDNNNQAKVENTQAPPEVSPQEAKQPPQEAKQPPQQEEEPPVFEEQPSQEGIYEEIPTPTKKVTIGGEEHFPAKVKRDKTFDHREVSYDTDGKVRIQIIGGNAEGIYVHRIFPGSDAERKGLMEGDQILKINGKNMKNRSKEEATLMLMSLQKEVHLLVRHKRERYEGIVNNGGMGDSFFVRALFKYDGKKGELNIKENDIFSVRDTLPEGKMGNWVALKVNAVSGEAQHGLIPNHTRAEQIILTQQMKKSLSLEKESKGGFLRRSLRRSKSVEKLSNKDKDNKPLTLENSKDIKSYERVEQQAPGFIRPVVLIGLFADVIIDWLVRECPDRFLLPMGPVERRSEGGENKRDVTIDVKPIRECIERRRHCLMLLSPKIIEHVKQAGLQPMIIYMSPGSKSILKNIKSVLAPGVKIRTNVMYEEATTFQKQHNHYFTATVPYSSDESWYALLKDTIGRIQNQPNWVRARPRQEEDDVDFDFSSNENTLLKEGGPQRPRLNSLPHRNRNKPSTSSSKLQNMSFDETLGSIINQQMSLTYDGFFLSDNNQDLNQTCPLPSPSPSLSSGQKSPGPPKSILKKRANSSTSLHSQSSSQQHPNNMPKVDHVIDPPYATPHAHLNQGVAGAQQPGYYTMSGNQQYITPEGGQPFQQYMTPGPENNSQNGGGPIPPYAISNVQQNYQNNSQKPPIPPQHQAQMQQFHQQQQQQQQYQQQRQQQPPSQPPQRRNLPNETTL